MTLTERITADLTAAMRAGDEDVKRTLRLVRAAIQNTAIESGGELDDAAVERVLVKQAKQRRDAIEQYERGGRDDLVAAERTELEIIQRYLPEKLSREEIEDAAREKIAAVGARGPGDMGRVMGPLMAELGARADGGQVSAVVRQLLSEQPTDG